MEPTEEELRAAGLLPPKRKRRTAREWQAFNRRRRFLPRAAKLGAVDRPDGEMRSAARKRSF